MNLRVGGGPIFRAIATLALMAPVPALADPVSASDPAGVVAALKAMGHDAVLKQDSSGEPLVEADIAGWRTAVVFYDCNEITHATCQSLQFNASFMPEKPFSPESAVAFVKDNRFGAVSVGADKSVNVSWDVITGKGIDASVFALVVKGFRSTLDTIGGEVFTQGHPARLASASR